MELISAKELTKEYLESIGCFYHTDVDGSSYISNKILKIDEGVAKNFYDAANELYDMYVEAGEYVINNNLFHEIGIPFNLEETIKLSWESDIHWHIYGRFDFSGGLDGSPIKLIEFNADTPTMLYESAIIQWALLKYNGYEESRQFNGIYEALVDNFKRIITMEEDVSRFSELYEGWKILFSSIKGSAEEEGTVKFLQNAASEAGFDTDFCYVCEAELNEESGISYNGANFEFWFKLIPWEDIAISEPELAIMIRKMMENKNSIFFNPAYTLMFQSKGMLKILWELFPNHPLLLKCDSERLDEKCVFKPFFGREGDGVYIYDTDGEAINHKGKKEDRGVYQQYANMPKIEDKSYQPSVFFAYEACGLGIREGGEIMDDSSKFVSHMF